MQQSKTSDGQIKINVQKKGEGGQGIKCIVDFLFIIFAAQL